MRIGIFTETYTPYISGLVTSEVMLKKALERMGHQVYVVTANLESFRYDYDEEERILRIPGVPTGIYDSRLTSIYPITAINKIKSWNLDIIHSQTEFAIGTVARILGKQLHIPVVHTYHTIYEEYVHYITHGHFEKSSQKLVEYLILFYCDKTITELIVPTQKAYNIFKTKYNVKRNIHIIPTGIEVERFYPENTPRKDIVAVRKQLNISKNDFVCIYVGRLAKEKNIEFLLDIFKDLSKKHENLKLLIVGDGPDREKYESISKKNQTENSIIFTGKVPWDKIPVYYLVSDAFITASTSETQGLTVIEAMAAELPVICIDDESFRIVVADGLDGLIFKDKKEAKEKITYLSEHKEEYHQMSAQARIAANRYSSKRFAASVLEVYEKAIEENNQKQNIFQKLWKKIKGVIK